MRISDRLREAARKTAAGYQRPEQPEGPIRRRFRLGVGLALGPVTTAYVVVLVYAAPQALADGVSPGALVAAGMFLGWIITYTWSEFAVTLKEVFGKDKAAVAKCE